MVRSWRLPVGGLLAAVVLFGTMAVVNSPDGGRAIGIWPVGLASAALVLTPRRRVPLVLALVGLIALATISLDRPPGVTVGLAAGTTAGVWVVWRLVTGGAPGRPDLRAGRDLARFLGALAAGALVVAAATAATSLVTGWGHPGLLTLTVTAAHVASHLTLLPFVAHLQQHPALATPLERAVQWGAIAVVTPLLFLPTHFPSLVFVVIPLLGWGALRNAPYEALVQLLVVLGVAVVMTTSGRGPFAAAPEVFGWPVDVRGALLAGFVVACGLVVLPLMLSVGQQLENARQAAAERDKVQNIVNSATGVAIIGTDETGRITLFNPGAQRLLGYAPEEVLGRATTMLHSPAGIAAQAAALGVPDDFVDVARAMVAPGSAGRDMLFRRKDGTERTHSMTVTRMTDDRGRVTGYVSTSEDVTERVRAQQAVEEALATERLAVERLQQVDQVKDAFVSSVSHELRTPITSIVGYLEMLAGGDFGELNAGQADAVRRVADNSARLLALIDDLLTLSRVQDEGFRLADRAFDLRDVVQAGYDVVAPAWAHRDLEAALELPDEPLPCTGDKDMVERVVVNLLGNAVKFTPDGGYVAVRVSGKGGEALIEVSDSGIGIPLAEQDQLFSRFFRSTVAQKRAIPGSGLGLSIARAVVEQHGGSVEVDSGLDRGTTFVVRLPLVV